MASQRPKVWDRERPPASDVLPWAPTQRRLVELCGYDPFRESDGFRPDARRGRAAVRWIHEHITHVKGSLGGLPLVLSEIEQAIVGALWGWRCEDGTRRYRDALIYVPRKFGKTLLAAALALLAFFEDGEPGAEVYCAAAARDQARLLWGPAKRMILSDEALSGRCRIYQHSIVRLDEHGAQDGAYFQAISSEANTAHGFNPHFFVVDELHAQPDGELVDVLTTGTGSRTQPLRVYITTADYERESLCNEVWSYASKARDGAVSDPRYLPIIFEACEDDDWTSPEVWARVNPHYPVTPRHDYLEAQCRKAQENPRYANTFKRLHLNLRTQSDIAWFDMRQWDACTGKRIDPEDLRGHICYGALDLSSVSDLTCFLLLFPHDGMAVLPWFWAPRKTALRRNEKGIVPSYLAWEDSGHMTLCKGGTIDQEQVKRRVVEAAETYDLRQLAVDRWQAAKIITELTAEGLPVTKFGQGYASMSAPSKELEALVISGGLRHGGHPVLRWNAGNAMVETDNSPAENIKPVKAKTRKRARRQDDNKIDGIVALVMALGVYMLADEDADRSAYEEHGIRTL